MTSIKIKRVYDQFHQEDGYRILVDRIWPRGLAKASAHIDEWVKDIAPTNELRKWFSHDIEKWEAFRTKYLDELKKSGVAETVHELVKKHKHITLLFGAKDEQHNQAVVLQEYLQRLMKKE